MLSTQHYVYITHTSYSNGQSRFSITISLQINEVILEILSKSSCHMNSIFLVLPLNLICIYDTYYNCCCCCFDSDTDFIDEYDVGQRDGTRLHIEFMVKI